MVPAHSNVVIGFEYLLGNALLKSWSDSMYPKLIQYGFTQKNFNAAIARHDKNKSNDVTSTVAMM